MVDLNPRHLDLPRTKQMAVATQHHPIGCSSKTQPGYVFPITQVLHASFWTVVNRSCKNPFSTYPGLTRNFSKYGQYLSGVEVQKRLGNFFTKATPSETYCVQNL